MQMNNHTLISPWENDMSETWVNVELCSIQWAQLLSQTPQLHARFCWLQQESAIRALMLTMQINASKANSSLFFFFIHFWVTNTFYCHLLLYRVNPQHHFLHQTKAIKQSALVDVGLQCHSPNYMGRGLVVKTREAQFCDFTLFCLRSYRFHFAAWCIPELCVVYVPFVWVFCFLSFIITLKWWSYLTDLTEEQLIHFVLILLATSSFTGSKKVYLNLLF